MLERRTQTNEPARCALMLPLLAALPQPLALLEVGASAGLCLLPDRYGYDYAGHRARGRPAALRCTPEGDLPLPDALPEVVWRAGLDLDPIDIDDADAMRWLELLIWPGEEHRVETLRGAVDDRPRGPAAGRPGRPHTATSRRSPPRRPRDATLVIFHTAVLSYVPSAGRATFRDDGRGSARRGSRARARDVLGLEPDRTSR